MKASQKKHMAGEDKHMCIRGIFISFIPYASML